MRESDELAGLGSKVYWNQWLSFIAIEMSNEASV